MIVKRENLCIPGSVFSTNPQNPQADYYHY
jgi:hypothetical protein